MSQSKSAKALIFGVNGQDGSYLSEFLLIKGYNVVGAVRRSSTNILNERLSGIVSDPLFKVVECDITDYNSVQDIINEEQPDEVYNLAAQSHVGTSFKQPTATWTANAVGTQNILEAITRWYTSFGKCRFYQASTSEMFGSVVDPDGFQRETTELSPNSPYAIAKVAAHHSVRLYRDAYGVFACSGILFNHESPRRGENFVTRKITKYIGKLVANEFDIGKTGYLHLGNIHAKRDWGYAKDYVRAMWMMLQNDKPDDYVVSTGETHSVEEFLDKAFRLVDKDYKNYVAIDDSLIRPNEVPFLRGDSKKIRETLGWKPDFSFDDLVNDMVMADIAQCQTKSIL